MMLENRNQLNNQQNVLLLVADGLDIISYLHRRGFKVDLNRELFHIEL